MNSSYIELIFLKKFWLCLKHESSLGRDSYQTKKEDWEKLNYFFKSILIRLS